MDPIKGIQTCNLNGGVIGNCPYKQVLDMLKEQEADIELEGGGSCWWNVCGECRQIVSTADKYCRQCGRRLRLKKIGGLKANG